MKTLIHIFVTAIAILITTQIIPGFHITNFITAILAALVLGLLNMFVKPILSLLTLPINILTLGLFKFILNAFILTLSAKIVSGFTIDGFIPALIGSILVTFISSLLSSILKD